MRYLRWANIDASANAWAQFISIIPLTLIALLACSESRAVTLEWDANHESNLAGYRMYYGAATGTYTNFFDVGNVTVTTVLNLAEGVTYYFAVTAYDSLGQESEFSNEVIYTMPVTIRGFRILPIRSGTLGNDNVTIEWESNPGSIFRVFYKEDLAAAEWISAGDVIALSSIASWTDPKPTSAARFYRILKVQ